MGFVPDVSRSSADATSSAAADLTAFFLAGAASLALSFSAEASSSWRFRLDDGMSTIGDGRAGWGGSMKFVDAQRCQRWCVFVLCSLEHEEHPP